MATDHITIIAELRDLISRPATRGTAALAAMEAEVERLDRQYKRGNITQDQYVAGMKRVSRTSNLAGADARRLRTEIARHVAVYAGQKRGLRAVFRGLRQTSDMSRTGTLRSRVFRREVVRTVFTLGATARNGLRGALSGAVGGLASLGKNLAESAAGLFQALPRFAMLGAIIAPLIPAVVALGGGLVAMAGSAAPMVGLLGAVPGLGLAAGAAIGVAAIGLSGLGEGIMALADGTATIEQVNEAWAKFTPEAKAFGVQMAGIIPGLRGVRDEIQRSLLPSLGSSLVALADVYIPFFTDKLGDIATVMGDVADRAASKFTAPAFLRDMTLVWDSTTRIIKDFGDASIAALSGLRGMMVAAIPLTENLSGGIKSMFDRFDRWANSPLGRNKMSDFFADALATSQTFFGALKDFAVGLWNIMMVGKGLGDQMGGSMADAAEGFRAWTSSTEGQQKITQFFEDIQQTLSALGRLFGAIFSEIFSASDTQGQNSVTSFIDGLTAAVPGLFKVIRALITLAGWVGKAIVWIAAFFTAIGQVPAIGGILQIIAAVVLFIGRSRMAWAIIRLVGMAFGFAFGGWVIALIGVIVGGLVMLYRRSETFRNVVKNLAQQFMEGFGQMRDIAVKVGGALRDAFGPVKRTFVDPIIEGVKSLIGFVGQLITKIGEIVFPKLPDFVQTGIRNFRNLGRDPDQNRRKDGGPVMVGQSYQVAEAGREFLLSASGVTLLGQSGPSTIRPSEPGVVLPNPMTERILAGADGPADTGAVAGRVPALAGMREQARGSQEAVPLPAVHVGPFYGAHPDEVRAAVSQGVRDAQRHSETKQTGGGRP